MATATATRKTSQVEEIYQRGYSLDEHGLRYFRTTDGRHHVVIHDFPAGEQDFPDVHRHDTIEEARATWRRIRDQLVFLGYARSTRPR